MCEKPDSRNSYFGAIRLRKFYFHVFRFLFSAGVIAYIIYHFDLSSVGAVLYSANFELIPLAILCQLISSAIRALRWQGLLAARHVKPGWPYLFTSVLSAIFFRQFMPSTIGGDAIRGYDSWKAGASPELSLTALVVDRVLGLVALALFVAIAIALWSETLDEDGQILQWSLLFLALIFGLFILMFTRWISLPQGLLNATRTSKIGKRLASVAAEFSAYRDNKLLIAHSVFLSVLLQGNIILFYVLISMILQIDIPMSAFLIIIPLAIVAMMAPISINGIGVREGVFILLLGFWGVSSTEALAFAWVEYGLIVFYGLIGGIAYSLRGVLFLRHSPYGKIHQEACDHDHKQ